MAGITGRHSLACNCQFESKDAKFKLDTGANVTAISEATFSSLPDTKLKESTKTLYGPAHTALTVIGQFTGNFKYNSACCKS